MRIVLIWHKHPIEKRVHAGFAAWTLFFDNCSCDDHAELSALLHDFKLVIVGGVGKRTARRLLDLGIEVVATPERLPAAQLTARHLAGTLERNDT